MLIHIPTKGGQAVGISIPRDDFTTFPGCPYRQCSGKIKQAYGLAYAQAAEDLARSGVKAGPARVQQQRDAGRRAEVAAVEQFLGGQTHVDHFVEVTLVAFYQLADVVQPVTVCLNENTEDRYSGANFHAGRQDVNASQAVAFVRQRRDTRNPALQFTDLDRDRRQQAFISSVLHQLHSAGTLSNPLKLSGIVGVATANLAIDDGLSPLDLARVASKLQGNVVFYTLPIKAFGRTAAGEDINLVDPPTIRATVASLLEPATPAQPMPAASPPQVTVQLVTRRRDTGQRLTDSLTAAGYHVERLLRPDAANTTSVRYGAGADAAAGTLASELGVTAGPDPALGDEVVQVTAGPTAKLVLPDVSATGTAASPVPADGSGGGTAGPPPTALTELTGSDVPCVK